MSNDPNGPVNDPETCGHYDIKVKNGRWFCAFCGSYLEGEE